jgi:threonine dehydrogenase-like Zn-dependent dehydrogenase
MKAVVWHGPKKVSVDEVDDPTLQEPTDAIVRITWTGICGSDLHLYDHGQTLAMKPGDILGHEPLGVVEEVGPEVQRLRAGDRVVVPFNISCGHCFYCQRQFYSQCETTQNLGGRKGAALFGYTHLYGGVAGGQAEFLRVPQAQFGPIVYDPSLPESVAVLLSDVLPTAWQAVKYADVPPGGSLAVFGLGPIGQMCTRIGRHLGAEQVIGVDLAADRLQTATSHGVHVIDLAAVDDVVSAIKELTGGRGADSVIDAVGMDASGSRIDRVLQATRLQPDRMIALHHSLGSVHRGGTVSVIGVYSSWMPAFPLGDLFDKQITLRWGQANVRRWTDEIQQVLLDGDPIDAASLVTTVAPLAEAAEWYPRFRDKEPGVQKVLLRCG